MKLFGTKKWTAAAAILIFVLCVAIVMSVWAFQNELQISNGLGVKLSEVVGGLSSDPATYRYRTAYTENGIPSDEGMEKLLIDEYAHCVTEEAEGAVLLHNENDALPLGADEMKLTLFGHATVQPLYRPRSGGAWTDGQKDLVTYVDALKNAGFAVNETLVDAYESSDSYRGGKGGGTGSPDTAFLLGEEPASFYTEKIKSSFEKSVAVIMLAREGGETRDLPVSDYEGKKHLELHDAEKDMLSLVKQYKDNGTFTKVILLLNTTNPLELGFLKEYGIDACMWIGSPGLRGFEGVADLLKGDANPSGRLVETYAANSLSAPAMVNFGDISYTNADKVDFADQAQFESKLVVYAEGIYQGYKYYETRYEDVVLGRYGADDPVGSTDGEAWTYADEVIYPFGHGLSYSEFSETLNGVTYDAETKEYVASVTVKNEGGMPGKHVVHLYAQTPYGVYERDNLVEKSAVQLAGFAKTGEIDEGSSETVEVRVDEYLLASYDHNALKGYYLSGGDYYFAIGDNVHDALNNVLAAKAAAGADVRVDAMTAPGNADDAVVLTREEDKETYLTSRQTGNRVTNLFDDADINYWVEDAVTYLTRKNWSGTYPTETTTVAVTEEMLVELDGYTYEKPDDAPGVDDFTLGKDAGVKFADMYGVPYDDDEKWDVFLDQLSLDDMVSILDDSFSTRGVISVSKPEQKNNDGPDGAQQAYIYGDRRGATCYPSETVLSSTWNLDLAAKRGRFLGEDNLYSGATQMWSPAANLHRTPYSGRNYEYYSEDPVTNYYFLGTEVREMQRMGVNVAPKHLAANDQETNRYGVGTFMTEQTLREGPLKGFEAAFTIGSALGVMTSYSRIGCTYAGQSSALQEDLLTDEWGFNGVIISDAVTGKIYQHPVEMQAAGNDMYCISVGADYFAGPKIKKAILDNDDGYLLGKLRETNKQFYYSFANSNLVNGLTSDSEVRNVLPWWQSLIIAIIVLLSVAAAGCSAMSIASYISAKRKEKEK